jgi:glycine/D-amino acid oxidase-like deaminating enzyme
LEEVAEHAARRLPVLVDLPVQSSWWGYYEVSPDWNALVGEAPDPGGFLYATGFSGHGFLQAPAVGEIVRDLVLGREPFVDVAALSAERFARAESRPERNVI